MQIQNSAHTLRLRPNLMPPTLGGILLVCGFLFLFLATQPPYGYPFWNSPALFASLLFTAALTLFFWCVSGVVLADENGLRWRNFGRWQSACWEEIDDYFFTISQNDGQPVSWLRFRDGQTLRLPESIWSDQTAFRALVVERATQAKPSGWLLRGKEGTITGRYVFAYKKRPDYFEADEQGVHYFNGHTHHEAAWSDVLALHDPQDIFRRLPATLETKDWSATFSPALRNHALLRAMVRQYAPHVSSLRLRPPSQELLMPTERSDGQRIFHYQTRASRRYLGTLLFIGLSFLGAALGLYLFTRQALPELTSFVIWEPIFWGVMSLLTWAVGLWGYKIERIIVDRESVTQIKRRGQMRVFFEEIKEIEVSSGTDSLVTHSGERPIRWRHSLANVAELRQEIGARIGH